MDSVLAALQLRFDMCFGNCVHLHRTGADFSPWRACSCLPHYDFEDLSSDALARHGGGDDDCGRFCGSCCAGGCDKCCCRASGKEARGGAAACQCELLEKFSATVHYTPRAKALALQVQLLKKLEIPDEFTGINPERRLLCNLIHESVLNKRPNRGETVDPGYLLTFGIIPTKV